VRKAKVQGGNAMVVQVVEARQLVAVHKDHSDPYVKLRYGETEVSTQHVDKTLSPFWNETFILDENLFSSKATPPSLSRHLHLLSY
jgi:Ca2+-dependent lipid-binding protein